MQWGLGKAEGWIIFWVKDIWQLTRHGFKTHGHEGAEGKWWNGKTQAGEGVFHVTAAAERGVGSPIVIQTLQSQVTDCLIALMECGLHPLPVLAGGAFKEGIGLNQVVRVEPNDGR